MLDACFSKTCFPLLSSIYQVCPKFPLEKKVTFSVLRVDTDSVLFSRSVVSDSLKPHGLQHARLPCSSPTPETYSNSRPSSQWCHPTISSCYPLLLPSIYTSIRVFSSESFLCIRWPKYWSFSFSISPSNEYSGLISFRMDCLDLLAEQGTLKSLFSARKTIALTRWTFVGKVISLLFNMLSRLIRAFLPRSKHLLISWLQWWNQSPSAVILEPPQIKSATVSTVSPSICHEVMGPDAMILVFCMLSFKPTFSLSSFTFIKRFFSSSLSAIRAVRLRIWG